VDALAVVPPQLEQALELALRVARMAGDRGIGEIAAPAADGAGALQQRLEAPREHGIARIDRGLHIADRVGEAELVRLGMAALRRQPVGDPHLGLAAAGERDGHSRAAHRHAAGPVRSAGCHVGGRGGGDALAAAGA
jgi:hypothetical protein